MKLSLLVVVACVLVGITSAANNCPGAAGTAGVNCTDASLCCGADTMTPSCLPADGSKKCCVHYIASTQCNPNQVCGGSGGPGASSYAQCGPPGSTFCDKGDGQGAFCTSSLPTCCGYYGGYGFCCAAGCACNNSAYSCNCPATVAPTTTAPTTIAPTTAAPTTTPAPPQNNCPGAGAYAGVNCSDPSLCCGYGTLTPSCLPANGTKKCCTHYLAATQCNPNQVCGGGGGPGASSYAQCGPPGSTFCDKGDGEGAFCTTASPTCCGYYGGYGFCCAAGCACNNSAYTCNCPTTAAPTTIAPTTAAPTTTPAPPQNNCPGAGSYAGVNCSDPSLCCGYGSLFPSCLPANGTKKCCTHYLAATQCDPDQVCGGGGGPGASSYAQCGPAGSTFCDKGDGQGAFCTTASPTCCGYYGGYGFCCAAGCACNNSAYSCNCPTTAAPTTIAPTTAAPTTTPAPPQNNCPGAGAYAGVNCSDPSLCCGYGSLTPSCLPANGTKKCCTHYLAATQCDPDQVCGGGGGPGASSYAQCGPVNSTFCDKGDGEGAFCTTASPTCCGYYGGYGFCCAAGCACNNSAYTCNCPTTVAPSTVPPTTAAPTTTPAPPRNNCPGAGSYAGVNCSDPSLCCGYGSLFPSCLPANGTKKCCTHYLAATQCNPNQVCGGGGGPGASSYATCGPPGSTFCDKGTGTGSFCNATLPTCCGYSGGYGFCCAAGCACNNSAYTCVCPTAAPTTPAPTTAPPPMPNCPGVNGYGGVNCSSASLCCGAGTITPSCLPANGSKKCCVHYLSSTQCNPNQVCGGSGGPGASSYAQCGPPGSTFCDKGDGQGAFCNATLPTCCGYYGGYGFCCAPGCACNNSAYTCNCPTPPPKPTLKPTPPRPTPPNQKTCRTPGPRGKPATCGVNQKCCGAPNTNSFCCPANKRCNNARRTCF